MTTDPIKFVYAVGDGATTDFSYAYNGTVGFDLDVAEDMRAAILNPDGTRDLTPNFAVLQDTYQNFTGFIRFAVPPVYGALVFMYRATPQTQETEYRTSSGFDAQDVEKDFDKLTKIVQEINYHARNSVLQLDMFQREPFFMELLTAESNRRYMLIDWANRTIRAGLIFEVVDGRFRLSEDGSTYKYFPSSVDIEEIRRVKFTNPDRWVYQYRIGAEWYSVGEDAFQRSVEALDKANQAVSTANAADAKSDAAVESANKAVETSNQALDIANKAKDTAESADKKSDAAVESANKAVETSNQANATSEQARDIAATANATADAAKQTADSVLGVAQSAESIANDAKATAESAASAAATATTTANAAKSTAESIADTAQNALIVANEANATATDAASQVAGAVEKADNAKAAADAVVDTASQAKQAADDALAKVDGKQDKGDYALNSALSTVSAQVETNRHDISDCKGDISALEYDKASKATDFITPVTTLNKGATKNEIDKLESKIDIAGTSGNIRGSYWFGKTKAETVVPAPTMIGQNYYDFTTGNVYKSNDGTSWEFVKTNTPPADVDVQIMITSKFWDIIEQENQHGGKAWWSHTNSEWSYSPQIYEEIQGGGAGRSVGDTFYTTRLDNELPGAVERNGAEYNIADVNGGNNNIQALLTSGALPYKSYTDWQAMVDTYGGCDSFAWDGGATFRVPLKNPRRLVRIVTCMGSTSAGGTSAQGKAFIYSDGYVEGSSSMTTNTQGVAFVDFGFAFNSGSGTDKNIVASALTGTQPSSWGVLLLNSTAYPATVTRQYYGCDLTGYAISVRTNFKGYAAPSEYTPDKWNYQDTRAERPMVQLFNGVTDEAVATCTGVLADVANLKQNVNTLGMRYLVRKKEPTAANPSWYNVYSDGWCEQGGVSAALTSNSANTVNLMLKYKNTAYLVMCSGYTTAQAGTSGVDVFHCGPKTTSTINITRDYTGTPQVSRANWTTYGYADPTEYTRDKWGDDTDYSTISVMTGDPSPFKFKAWTNDSGQTVYTLLAVPIARGDDMYTEDQLAVYNEWDANQSTAPLPKVEDRCGALGIVNGNRAINGGGVQMGTPGELDAATAYVRNQALDTNG